MRLLPLAREVRLKRQKNSANPRSLKNHPFGLLSNSNPGAEEGGRQKTRRIKDGIHLLIHAQGGRQKYLAEEACLLRLAEEAVRRRAWANRGWLVMMLRAHHQGSLGRNNTGQETPVSLASTAATGVRVKALADDDHSAPPQPMELCEEGASMSRFASAVATVIEIEIEDVFRHIITYV